MIKLTKQASDFGKVAVLMGGYSAEREISLQSGAAVLAALKNAGVDAIGIDIKTSQDILNLKTAAIDMAFIAVHGRGGEDGTLQAALDIMGIQYTGSKVIGCAVSMDKLRSKLLWAGAHLPVPDYQLLQNMDDLQNLNLDFPLMIKPSCEGSSIGISKVHKADDLPAAYKLAKQYGTVFAERFVNGGEYTVGIIGEHALPIIKLQTSADFYDYHAKYQSEDTQYICPCGLDQKSEQALQQLALQAFKSAGGSEWGRIDMMLDKMGNPYLIEMNAVPGMTNHSLVPLAASVAGVDFATLVQLILQQSLEAHNG